MGALQRKRPRAPAAAAAAEVEEQAAKRLAAHGEAFLRLFGEDAGPVERAAPHAAAPQAPALASTPEAATPDEDAAGDSDSGISDAPGTVMVFHQPRTCKRTTPARRSTDASERAPRAGVGGERRRFLSGRAEHVHAAATGPALRAATGARTAAAEELKDFEKMRQEVHLYGAGALDKRQRKAFEAARLQSLNARADKAPRTTAAIGLGMARKRAQRERDAQEAAIDAGLLQRKGLGKKRERAARAALAARGARGAKTGRAGLREDNGAFRAGVLRVRLGAGGRGRGRGRGGAARGGGARGARRGGGRGGGRGGRE